MMIFLDKTPNYLIYKHLIFILKNKIYRFNIIKLSIL